MGSRSLDKDSDSLVVLAGDYPDTIRLGPLPGATAIVAPLGPHVTRVRAIEAGQTMGMEVTGFAVAEFVDAGTYSRRVSWLEMIFESGYSAHGTASPDLRLCTFRGRTFLTGFTGPGAFDGLRFESATLHLSGSDGRVELTNCEFVGPIDTLVSARPGNGDNPYQFVSCRFSGANWGVVCPEPPGWTGLYFERCVFSDLASGGIWYHSTMVGDEPSAHGMRLEVRDCRFTRCSTAVHWFEPLPNGLPFDVTLVRDTVEAGPGVGIALRTSSALFLELDVVGRSGHGVELFRTANRPPIPGKFLVDSCRFLANTGDGFRLVDSLDTAERAPIVIRGVVASGNNGMGMSVASANVRVENCIVDRNGLDGVRVDRGRPALGASAGWDLVAGNTITRNGGDGIRLERDEFAHPAPVQIVDHNLLVLNGGGGMRTYAGYGGSVACNDAWLNYSGQLFGVFPPDSNLYVDPKFCNLAAGDLHLEESSPVGPDGACGLVGARSVACPSTVAAPAHPPGMDASMWPNPARHEVRLIAGAGAHPGTVEIFDSQGRRVWSGEFEGAGDEVRWEGSTSVGRAQPGLYLVRFTQLGRSTTRRLIWLH